MKLYIETITLFCHREPFKEEGEGRLPTLTWPREIPVRSEGGEVVPIVDAYNKWLKTSHNLPKLYIDAAPGFFSANIREIIKNWPNQKVIKAKGLHFLQEDSPDDIGKAVAQFVRQLP